MKIATEVAASKAAARALFDLKGSPITTVEVVELLSQLHGVDCKLLQWQQSLPDSWKSHSVLVKEDDCADRANRKSWDEWVYVHSGVWVSAHVTTFHVLRLHANAVRLRVLQELGDAQQGSQSLNDCRNCLQDIADAICACVAPAIGDVLSKADLPLGIETSSISGRAIVSP